MKVAVHVTHETVKKIGGIGAVINGMCSSSSYRNFFEKTLLYGPVFGDPMEAVREIERRGKVILSTLGRGRRDERIEMIARKYNADVIFGKKVLFDEISEEEGGEIDVLVLSVQKMNLHEVARFKFVLWEKFGISSDLYESNWDYEQYLRIGVPFCELLKALYGEESEFWIFAHEYMGLPSAFSALVNGIRSRRFFVAHEVSTARFIVESHHGHDITFYNILKRERGRRSLEEVFGSQKNNPRNELIKRANHLDLILPVSDLVKEEFLFLLPSCPPKKLKVIYNGIPVKKIAFEEKREARRKMMEYVKNLLGFIPDVVFTHVARFVLSKGFWRDLTLLHFLEPYFSREGKTGIYILLSTLVATGREPEDIMKMEREYGWPVYHKRGWPDLVGGEAEMYEYIKIFNSTHQHIKCVFINQFGFSRERCGMAVPEGMDFRDFRIASDAEFGLSIYEPYGISHVEVIPSGGISIISSSCGAAFFLKRVFEEARIKPFYILDFIKEGERLPTEKLLTLSIPERDVLERRCMENAAGEIFSIIPKGDEERKSLLEGISEFVEKMDWNEVFKNYLLEELGLGIKGNHHE